MFYWYVYCFFIPIFVSAIWIAVTGNLISQVSFKYKDYPLYKKIIMLLFIGKDNSCKYKVDRTILGVLSFILYLPVVVITAPMAYILYLIKKE